MTIKKQSPSWFRPRIKPVVQLDLITIHSRIVNENVELRESVKESLKTHVWIEAVHGEMGSEIHFTVGGWYPRKDLDFLNQYYCREVVIDVVSQQYKIRWEDVNHRVIENFDECLALTKIYGRSRSNLRVLEQIFNGIVDDINESII